MLPGKLAFSCTVCMNTNSHWIFSCYAFFVGKEEILNCTGFLGYYMQEDASLYWLINQTFPEQCTGIPENEPSICEEEFKKLQ